MHVIRIEEVIVCKSNEEDSSNNKLERESYCFRYWLVSPLFSLY